MDSDLRNMLIVCGTVIGATILIITASYLIIGYNDDRPDWANDMASQLDEKGGRVYYYGNGVAGSWSGATPIFRINVDVGEEVYANSQGIVLRTSNGITQIPYERVYSIYIEEGSS